MNNSQKIRLPKKDNEYTVHLFPDKNEIVLSEFSADTKLTDIVHNYFSNERNLKPVKCIKIGNGGMPYESLKSIIILDNSDFIIVDNTGSIIDYITNGNPCETIMK